jgi:hypothetical protein
MTVASFDAHPRRQHSTRHRPATHRRAGARGRRRRLRSPALGDNDALGRHYALAYLAHRRELVYHVDDVERTPCQRRPKLTSSDTGSVSSSDRLLQPQTTAR